MTTVPNPPDSLLKLREPDLKPFSTRLSSVTAARNINAALTTADRGRSRIRALTKGMLDGNPPYSEAQRRQHGLKWTANLNFMEAEAAVDSARVPYYDIITGAPMLVNCCTNYRKTDPEWSRWNDRITEHFDWLLKQWKEFHFYTWNEQYWMLVEGYALNLFDEVGWKWRSLQPSCVRVPKRAFASLDDRLPYIIVRMTYVITELWEMIKDEDAAKALGYKVDLIKRVIMASDNTLGPNNLNWKDQPWEEWQRRLRSNDIEAGVSGEDVTVCHFYVKEFNKPGEKKGISHFMFTETAVGVTANDPTVPGVTDDFIYKSLHKFHSYDEALNVIFQNTADGYWHSVRGMAMKGFKHWDVNNRTMCKIIDNAFQQSSTVLETGDQTDYDKLQMIVRSDVTFLPAGCKVANRQLAGSIEGAMATSRMITNHLANNLGVYNQRTLTRDDGRGEMPTATQVDAQISKEAMLSNGQMGLYFLGRDRLYTTAFKKAVESTEEDALEFVERCIRDGVPMEALKDMDYIMADRTAGYGSASQRKQGLQAIGTIIQSLPEDGKEAVLDDFISVHAGVDKVQKYNPKKELPTPDIAWATMENMMLHNGQMPVMFPGQDNVQHIQIHLADAQQTLGPIKEAIDQEQSDPQAVATAVQYVQLMIPHVQQHIANIQNDPSRKQFAKLASDELKQMVAFSGEMFGILRDTQRQMQIEAQQQQQATALGELDQAKLDSTYQDMQLRQQKTLHGEHLKDIKLAGSERRANIQLVNQIGSATAKTVSDIRLKSLTNGQKPVSK